MAQISASAVIISEPEYQYSSSAVITKATPKNTSTPAAPLAMSPTALAKPMMWTAVFSFSYLARIFSSWAADRLQVESLAGLRVVLHQCRDDHRRGLVVRDDSADPVGLQQVLAHLGHLFRGAGEIGGHHVAAAEAVLDDLVEAHVRGEQRRN